MINALLPQLMPLGFGRLLFVESMSTKQPIENLALSNSMRLAVVGYAKTLSDEVASSGITVNTLGPGFHDTPAAQRVIRKKSEVDSISYEEAKEVFLSRTKMKKMGSPTDFASLAVWLLSPLSSFITGQVISVDGGLVKGTMG